MSKSLLLSTLFAFSSFLTIAQTTIKGKVLDNANKQGVPFVNVSLLAAQDSSLIKGAISDSTGFFELTSISRGNYLLRFSSVEHQKLYQRISLENTTQVIIQLPDVLLTSANHLLH